MCCVLHIQKEATQPIKCIWFYFSHHNHFHSSYNFYSESHHMIQNSDNQTSTFCEMLYFFLAEKLKFICKPATHYTMRIVMSLIENPMSVKSVMVAWEWEWSITMHRINEAHLIYIGKNYHLNEKTIAETGFSSFTYVLRFKTSLLFEGVFCEKFEFLNAAWNCRKRTIKSGRQMSEFMPEGWP